MSSLGGITALLCLLFLGFNGVTSALEAEVEDLSDQAYFIRAVSLIDQAKESIAVSLYEFDVDPARPKHPGTQLFEALLRAGQRKVAVYVLLNRNYEFQRGGEDSIFTRNDEVYAALKEGGLHEVYFADPSRRLHDKLAVIDREWVMDGSHNWSSSALRLNRESSTLIRSREYAHFKEERIKGIKRVENQDEPERKIHLENAFLKDPRYLARFVKTQDFRSMALYLWLRFEADQSGGDVVEVDLEKMADWLGLPKEWDRAETRRQVIRVLKKKLADRYGLIETEIPFGQKARIRLLPFSSEMKGFLNIPAHFFEYGSIRSLSHAGLTVYLGARYLSETSPIRPWWSVSQEAWASLFNISPDVIQTGSAELRRFNLLEVLFFGFEQKPFFKDRPSNQYRLNRILSESEEKGRWQKIRGQSGKSAYVTARRYARDLGDPRDPELVEKLIALSEKYPPPWVTRVMRRIKALKADNPRKNIHYIEGILNGFALAGASS